MADCSIRWMAGPEKQPVHRAGPHALRAVLHQRLRRVLHRPARVDDVVLDDAGPALHLADDVHHLGMPVLGRAALVDDREFRVQPLGVGARPLRPAGVRRDDRDVLELLPRDVVDDDRRREQVVHRDVEEALDLRLVQVHRQHAVRAGGAQDVRHELGRDRHARLVLAILARVAVIRDHRRDARRGRAPERVDHHQQLHDVLVDGRAGRLHDEDVGAADVLLDLERHLGVGEPAELRLPHLDPEHVRDAAGQFRMCAAREDLHVRARQSARHVPVTMAGWGGRIRTFECGIQSPVPYQLGDAPPLVFPSLPSPGSPGASSRTGGRVCTARRGAVRMTQTKSVHAGRSAGQRSA